eukprot:4091683-Karenia_brevis.AAC.1
MTPPTAWFCPKCGLDHHNSHMLTCRRPNCGGHNPTKPPLDVPPANPNQGSASSVIHPCSSSPSYLHVLQQPSISPSSSTFSPGIQQVATPAMLRNIARLGYQHPASSPEDMD